MSLKPPTLGSSSELTPEADSLKPPTAGIEASVEESIEITEVDEVSEDGSLKPPTP